MMIINLVYGCIELSVGCCSQSEDTVSTVPFPQILYNERQKLCLFAHGNSQKVWPP